MKPTVGEQLRAARNSRGISLTDAVKATHIRSRFLQELENDHPELLDSTVQARGFLRLYAEYLGLSFADLLSDWESDKEPQNTVAEKVSLTTEEERGADAIEPPADSPKQTEGEPISMKDESRLPEKFSLLKIFSSLPKISELIPRRGAKDQSRLSTDTNEPDADFPLQIVKQSEEELSESSVEIFKTIGSTLRERRLALELTLSDAERFTNVKRMYLNALETGGFDELPSTVQGRGMLKNYSKFLALDDTSVMDSYARGLQAQRIERMGNTRRPFQPPLTVKLNIPEKWRRILNPDLILGGLFIVAMFIFIIWGSAQVFSGGEPTPTEAPSISEVLQQTPSPTVGLTEGLEGTTDPLAEEETPIPGVAVIQSTPTQIATVNSAPLQLYIIAHDRAYVNIIVDGVQAFDGRILPDNVYTYSGQTSIDLLTGNGAALEVYFNQEYLGNLGSVGQVARITFSEQGLSTPTPEALETPIPEPIDAMDVES
jgi:cytoskeleton protein RodZ